MDSNKDYNENYNEDGMIYILLYNLKFIILYIKSR